MTAYIAGYVLFVTVWFICLIKSLRGKQKTAEVIICGGILGVSVLVGSLLIAHVKVPSFILACQVWLEPIGMRLLNH
ncbi:hypothetical protein PghCCS26_15240 [Paenibacillus glycanilyticus]|uniref:Uncharacterized protein n=1 Tax=Paenibacillus glycanilyticus TaxID=126569 RepID=A0ABQ6NH29_9BACL|nr:hypothetical protein PghCCS26_15240 [Paenibacillus glycanilyticus]